MKANKFILSILTIILINSNQSLAQANTQSVCVNKQTGEVRLSNQCTPDESKATRKVTPPKLSKAEQLKKKISDLESQLVSIESERNKLFDSILKFSPNETSIDSYFESCDSNPQQQKCETKGGLIGLWVTLEKQSLAANKLLYRYKREAGIYRTITCKKGSETLTITDEKPKCPKGYK